MSNPEEQTQQPTPSRKVVAQIVIVYDGQNVMVNAPMHDKMLCLGMIELAKTVINNAGQPKINLVPPQNGLHT